MVREYFYIKGVLDGKYVLVGAYSTYDEAANIGYQRLKEQFDIVSLPTKDISEASRIIKARNLANGLPSDVVVGKFRHQGKDIGVF